MAVAIRYMGAKHGLAPKVARVVDSLPSGPCLDLFAGMCSVAGALSASGRATWCNDVQAYATTVARALVATPSEPDVALIRRSVSPFYVHNRAALRDRFALELTKEHRVISRGYRRQYKAFAESWQHPGNDESRAAEFARLRLDPSAFPYRLLTVAYATGYFGVCQAIDLDSLIYGIRRSMEDGQLSESDGCWSIVAVLQTASRVASTTGHFAEYLHPHSAPPFRRIRALRRRNVLDQWCIELMRIAPYGSRKWRSQNQVFTGDAATTLRAVAGRDTPAVVYADPPYSRAQYSRYYHVLETIVRYDYPQITGVGRYRDGRFQTPFSHAASVETAFEELIDASAAIGASLILSYPSNGLLYERGVSPAGLMKRRFRRVTLAGHAKAVHSTLGGASGTASLDVRELIFVGQEPD